jgi:tRNA-2-methylthio-N6-dimethylallyladenosine synthase
MNRRYTAEHYLGLLADVRSAIPDVAVSGDIIVGFPGETEEDFEATMRLVEAADYDQLFTFIFSPRTGTPAATMPDPVARQDTQRRFDRLVEAIQRSALAHARAYEGTDQRVLLEGVSDRDATMLKGRTDTNKVVHVPTPEGVDALSLAGTFADVHIDTAHTWFLRGTLRG